MNGVIVLKRFKIAGQRERRTWHSKWCIVGYAIQIFICLKMIGALPFTLSYLGIFFNFIYQIVIIYTSIYACFISSCTIKMRFSIGLLKQFSCTIATKSTVHPLKDITMRPASVSAICRNSILAPRKNTSNNGQVNFDGGCAGKGFVPHPLESRLAYGI